MIQKNRSKKRRKKPDLRTGAKKPDLRTGAKKQIPKHWPKTI